MKVKSKQLYAGRSLIIIKLDVINCSGFDQCKHGTRVILQVLLLGLRWFLDPYFKWRNQKAQKNYVLIEEGKEVEAPAKAFLLDPAYDNSKIDLSIVIPAYNEQDRLPHTMTKTLEYLEAEKKKGTLTRVEIIIVDDGSKDATLEIIKNLTK